MTRLGRQIRFSINPFLDEDVPGYNAYTSKPAGEGLAIFLQLDVQVVGPVRPETGFIINVVEIDQAARDHAVPVFAEHVRAAYRKGEHVGLNGIVRMLSLAWRRLTGKFDPARIDRLALWLNPFRKITMDDKNAGTICFSEKFEFAAMHKLWNDDFSERQNFEVFGKCANPTGHGHNYIVEVTVEVCSDAVRRSDRICPHGHTTNTTGFQMGAFQQVVETHLIDAIDHKNLNADVPDFANTIPTIENLAAFAWSRLVGRFGGATLHSITIWESDRTYCTYRA